MKTIAIKLLPKAEKAIVKGHPWIFENSIVHQNKEGDSGDIAIIFGQRSNKLLAVGLYDPHSTIRIRILSIRKSIRLDKDFFQERIANALLKRKDLLKTETTGYRLIYGENDQLPGMIIDNYDSSVVIKLYTTIWFPYLDIIVEALKASINVRCIVLRMARIVQNKNSSYREGMVLYGDKDYNGEVVFKEHGLLFSTNIIQGHKTGFFLDHRHNRLRIRSLAKDRHVLDVFSYSGGFSVNALAGGAKSVSSVDLSKQALLHAEKNAELNGFEGRLNRLSGDAFDLLEQMTKEKKLFDLIIIDPPSFAKSETQKASAIISYKRLLHLAVKLSAKKAIILFASCSSRIKMVEFDELVENILSTPSLKGQFAIRHKGEHDIDHPQGIPELDYLKAIYIHKKS